MATPSRVEGYRRIKRAARACQRCHSRKVRCDATLTGFPCTNCRLDTHPCQAFSGGRDRQKQVSLKRAQALAEISKTSSPRGPNAALSKRNHGVYLPCAYYSFIQPLEVESVDSAKIFFLEAQACLSLPNTSEVDVFVRHYFLYLHPFTPVLDEAAFWRAYRGDGRSGMQISLFLLRAMMFAASCFLPIEVARRCGYDSLLDARDDLYQKAKQLYNSTVEKDPLTIARATLLLTYYSSDSEVNANSDWLRIAIRHAKTAKATKSEMKRLWWSCLIRDRIISLGMRRSIQITAADSHLYPEMFTKEEFNDEAFGSRAYKPEIKAALFDLLISLCQFVTAVTELVTMAYPEPKVMARMDSPRVALAGLETAKSALLLWELDWMVYMEGRNFALHSAVPLFSGLLCIYYQSARVALCNRVCLVLNEMVDSTTRYLQNLDSCRSELAAAISSIADKVGHLITIKAIDKLPISIAAYTTTPFILLSITSQSTSTGTIPNPNPKPPQTKNPLPLFTAINHSLSLRFPTTRLSNLASRAIWLSKILQITPVPVNTTSHDTHTHSNRNNIFSLPLQQYTQLLRYIDASMSIPRDSARETSILYEATETRVGPMSRVRGESCAGSRLSGSENCFGWGLERGLGLGQMEVEEEVEATPVWMEGMENFFFGPGRILGGFSGFAYGGGAEGMKVQQEGEGEEKEEEEEPTSVGGSTRADSGDLFSDLGSLELPLTLEACFSLLGA
ncbi:hypothetical protein BJY04DRAFT_212454 [Aspergillus karnatakaensis]|uniref:Zn(II)2Cys6 transcription factor n=1 Tax=Aspergillus karnatakaensis TaxID=1810916 RepID=UPI003CCDEA7E